MKDKKKKKCSLDRVQTQKPSHTDADYKPYNLKSYRALYLFWPAQFLVVVWWMRKRTDQLRER